MLASPPVGFLFLLIGLAGGVLLAAALLPATVAGVRKWTIALVIVLVGAVGVTVPSMARNGWNALGQQRQAYAGNTEERTREKCLNDFSRPDLVAALRFAREQMPENARFLWRGNSPIACIAFNLLPRRPALPDDFDPDRDWTVFDRAVPEDVARAAQRDQRRPVGERQYLVLTPAFVLVRPRSEVTS